MLIRNYLTPYIHSLLAVKLKFSELDATSVKKKKTKHGIYHQVLPPDNGV